MANEVRINLNVTGEQKAQRALDKTGDAAAKAGDKLEGMGKDAGHLRKQADEAAEAVKRLTRELDKTGDESLKKDIRKERKRLREAESLIKELVPEADVTAAGMSIGKTLQSAIGAGVQAGGPAIAGVLGAAAVTAAPGIAATIGAAVVGGVGAGGIAGGIALAAQDPAVQAAGRRVGDALLGEFQDAADGFVEPLVDSLAKLGSTGWANKLAPTFDMLATKVEPLADGLIGLVDNVLPGIESAGRAAGPVVDSLAAGLPVLGEAVGDFFESVSDNPEALATALDLFIDTSATAIEVAGDVTETLIGIYGVAADVAEGLGIISEEETKLTKYTGGADDALGKFGKTAEEAAEEAISLGKAIDELFGRTLGVQEATLAYEQAVDDLMTELTDGKRTLDESTQAGRDNWSAINDQARAINDLREANIRNKVPLADANKLYEQQFEQLRKTLLNLGYNKTAVNEYIDRLKNIPKSVRTTVLIDAFANNAALLALAGAGAVSGKRASGGPVLDGQTYLVGENGPELLTMGSSSGYVHNAGQTRGMMAGGMGYAPQQPMQVNVTMSLGPGSNDRDLIQKIVSLLQVECAIYGGDAQAMISGQERFGDMMARNRHRIQ